MIEMVYSSKESGEQGEVVIPKNIKQMGENDANQKNLHRRQCHDIS